MDAAHQIRQAVEAVSRLRAATASDPALGVAVREVKRLQALRFSGTYEDLLRSPRYAAAARFFLEELYSDRDYADRDAQFARIAPALERMFPAHVTQTAVALAQLHALTEGLDHAMGLAWREHAASTDATLRYAGSWRSVGRRGDRHAQLAAVLAMGTELARLTRTPGLRMMLKMMRGPAAAAGLGALQRFLETGFDTFAGMARQAGAVEGFLATVDQRESALMESLFEGDLVASGTELARILGQAR